MRFSVIVPVSPGDSSWLELAEDLKILPPGIEILFSGPEMPREAPGRLASLSGGRKVQWIRSSGNMACRLNEAATKASGDFLWFLPSEARLSEAAVLALATSIQREELALHCFSIGAGARSPAWLDWFRARILKRPVLRHGYCLSRDLFDRVGGFPEEADESFLRELRRNGVPVRCAKGSLRG